MEPRSTDEIFPSPLPSNFLKTSSRSLSSSLETISPELLQGLELLRLKNDREDDDLGLPGAGMSLAEERPCVDIFWAKEDLCDEAEGETGAEFECDCDRLSFKKRCNPILNLLDGSFCVQNGALRKTKN